MGKIKDGIMAEAHHYAHVANDSIFDQVRSTQRPILLEQALAEAYLDGMEAGCRLTAGDVVCGRRLIAAMEKWAKAPVGEERATVASAERLLKVLSQR